MPINIPQFIISIPLFLILFFGIGFTLNMILRTTWVPTILGVGVIAYFWISRGSLTWIDIVILTAGLIGAVISGLSIKLLRKKGYRMF